MRNIRVITSFQLIAVALLMLAPTLPAYAVYSKTTYSSNKGSILLIKHAAATGVASGSLVPETHMLVEAVNDNDTSRLRALFKRGYSPAAIIKNKLRESLLDRAASNGSDHVFVAILNEMRARGLKPRLTDSRGTPLIVVLSSLATIGQKTTERYERMATALVEISPESLKLTDRAYVGDGRTALHQAAASGNVKLIRAFIARGAKVNAKNTSGETPLHLAARFGHIDSVRELIASGANIHEKTIYTKATPLMAAAEMGQETVIRILMGAGAQKNERDIFGKSAPQRYKEYAANFYSKLSPPERSTSSSGAAQSPLPAKKQYKAR